MPARQLHLFAPPRPLVQRLGEEFFRRVPREPGVYVMTGRSGLVLYVGQSRNLRQRLASYKNAQPDRAPRKVVRLVRAVASITWETCGSANGAKLRENELLRLHRPRFNRQNTWPRAYSFIRLKFDEAAFELIQTRKAARVGQLYGAFKAHATAGFGALLRLTWAAWHKPRTHHDFPRQLLGSKPPRRYRYEWNSTPAPWKPDSYLSCLENFLSGKSDDLVRMLTETAPAPTDLSPFQRALQASDLEILCQFYEHGPRRNHELSQRHDLPTPLVLQDELDDLLAENS